MPRWTDQETELLRLNHQRMEYADLAQIIGKTETAVRNKCHRLGLRKKASAWTGEELRLLREYYQQTDTPDLAVLEQLFIGRHKTNICRKAAELGLTKQGRPLTEETKQKIGKANAAHIAINGHPRGFAGHSHSQLAKRRISQVSKQAWTNPDHAFNSEENRQARSDRMAILQASGKLRNSYSRGRQGKRADLDDLYVRSSWEANYARYLNWLKEIGEIKDWEYEPETFWFHTIKRGTRSYTPDFRVTNPDGSIEYHEVKGWMDQRSRTKLARMAKYYPEIPIVLIDAAVYKGIAANASSIVPNWE